MQVIANVEDAFVLRRRALRQAQGRRRLMLLLGCVAVVVAVVGYWGLRMSSAFDVTRVQVVGTSGPLGSEVEAAVASQTQGKSLLGMDAGAIQRKVEAIPFVRSARVDRAFPHTLAVHVVPYTPAAYAMIGKQVYPISSDGRVLADHGKVPRAAPVVLLPDGTTLTVGQHTGDENIASALEVLSRAHGFGSHVTQLLPRSGTITAVLNTGTQLRFGSPSDLALKMQVVERVLTRITGAQRRELAYLDVSAPARPALGFHGTSPSTTT
jgi:cell division protein FtsQ